MNIPLFPVAITNVFPMANSTNGGQLATEFNMRSRESVATSPEIEYDVGPTYVHSSRDFHVSSSDKTTLVISAGKAVINGHFVQTLSDISIDLIAAIAATSEQLSGDLTIGIRMIYADTALSGSTLSANAYAGALLPEDDDTQMYKGLQFVILPTSQFKLPKDVPTSEASVSAHLKLANFRFVNGSIRGNIENVAYTEQSTVLDASRIGDIDSIVGDRFVTKQGIQPNKIYVFAGKPIVDQYGEVSASGEDTWCDSTDSIMVWDKSPQSDPATDVDDSEYGQVDEASFHWNDQTDQLDFVIPHKQIDGGMMNVNDPNSTTRYKYYPKVLSLPSADFDNLESYGLVTPKYTSAIEDRLQYISNSIFYMYGGNHTERMFMPVLTSVDELPTIPTTWETYDFILVGRDATQTGGDVSTAPATIYVIVPKPAAITSADRFSNTPQMNKPVSGKSIAQVELDRAFTTLYLNDIPDIVAQLNLMSPLPTGLPGDYITVKYTNATTYWIVTYSDPYNRDYSDPVWLTYSIPLATETTVGGFRNVSDTQLGSGYVFMDSEGHLRVLDYEKLASGALAYQLGHDQSFLNLTFDELQNQLDAYVNERVAFPDIEQLELFAQGETTDFNVINITIQLPDDTSASSRELLIHDIDSRFGASVYLHILGSATTNTTVSIKNCQRIRVDNNISGTPNIILDNCELFYDATVINYATSIVGLKLWYQLDGMQNTTAADQASAPQIYVDGMTVYQKNVPLAAQDIDAFAPDSANDLHYALGLDSVTLDEYGSVVGLGIKISDSITSNNSDVESFIVSQFALPHGAQLVYPYKKMNKKIKVSGEFMTAYPVTSNGSDPTHHVHTNTFTLTTESYDDTYSEQAVKCTLAIRTTFSEVTPIIYDSTGSPSPIGYVIPGLESGSVYTFSGRVIS